MLRGEYDRETGTNGIFMRVRGENFGIIYGVHIREDLERLALFECVRN